MLKLITTLFAVFMVTTACAQTQTNDWQFHGTNQTITYFDGRDFNNDTYAPYHTSSKLIFGTKKMWQDKVEMVINAQGWYVFGENDHLVRTSNAFGIIDGYLKFKDVFGIPLDIQAGRFRMEYGTGRFISNSFWNYRERKFDGFRFLFDFDQSSLDAFIANHSSQIKSQTYGSPLNSSPGSYNGYNIYGLWYNTKALENNDINLFGYLENNAAKIADETDLNRYTVGTEYTGNFGNFGAEVQAAYQFGTKRGLDIAAYLAAIGLNYKMDNFMISAGADLHSGSDDGNFEEINTFDNYMAAKHRFMGLMDYFVIARNAYNGFGVNDIHIGGKYTAGNMMYKLAFHHFMANNKPDEIDETAYGQEIDLIARYKYSKKIFVELGQGLFMPGDLMKNYYNDNDDMSFVTYLRAVVKL